jgi:hypothetical protein
MLRQSSWPNPGLRIDTYFSQSIAATTDRLTRVNWDWRVPCLTCHRIKAASHAPQSDTIAFWFGNDSSKARRDAWKDKPNSRFWI